MTNLKDNAFNVTVSVVNLKPNLGDTLHTIHVNPVELPSVMHLRFLIQDMFDIERNTCLKINGNALNDLDVVAVVHPAHNNGTIVMFPEQKPEVDCPLRIALSNSLTTIVGGVRMSKTIANRFFDNSETVYHLENSNNFPQVNGVELNHTKEETTDRTPVSTEPVKRERLNRVSSLGALLSNLRESAVNNNEGNEIQTMKEIEPKKRKRHRVRKNRTERTNGEHSFEISEDAGGEQAAHDSSIESNAIKHIRFFGDENLEEPNPVINSPLIRNVIFPNNSHQ